MVITGWRPISDLVHQNKHVVDQLFYKEEFYGSIKGYSRGDLKRNQAGWDSMIGARQVKEHLDELYADSKATGP